MNVPRNSCFVWKRLNADASFSQSTTATFAPSLLVIPALGKNVSASGGRTTAVVVPGDRSWDRCWKSRLGDATSEESPGHTRIPGSEARARVPRSPRGAARRRAARVSEFRRRSRAPRPRSAVRPRRCRFRPEISPEMLRRVPENGM